MNKPFMYCSTDLSSPSIATDPTPHKPQVNPFGGWPLDGLMPDRRAQTWLCNRLRCYCTLHWFAGHTTESEASTYFSFRKNKKVERERTTKGPWRGHCVKWAAPRLKWNYCQLCDRSKRRYARFTTLAGRRVCCVVMPRHMKPSSMSFIHFSDCDSSLAVGAAAEL